MIGLLDCNNFYASCERVFNPKLINRPMVVLSNNDGCIVARSKEAKELKIPMGEPIHKCKDIVEAYNVAVFSANFTLYGDMSRRVMSVLKEEVKDIEIYSIDEAFIKFPKWLDKKSLEFKIKYVRDIRDKVTRYTGIPVSIGVAPNKTLSKICNHVAKKDTGVFLWEEIKDSDNFLKQLPVSEVWGIGFKTTLKLNSYGIYSSIQLRDCNRLWLKKNFSITEVRIADELKELTCLTRSDEVSYRKQILSSRSFGRPVTTYQELEEAVSSYISIAGEKLRSQRSLCSYIYVSIKTNKFNPNIPQYFNYHISSLKEPSDFNPELIKAGINSLKNIYKKGYLYKKASVMLLGITSSDNRQLYFNTALKDIDKKGDLMKRFDNINRKYGREVIKCASSGTQRKWQMKKRYYSNQYTTDIDEVIKVF